MKAGFFSQFTVEQMRKQYAANVVSLEKQIAAAKAKGKAPRGTTFQEMETILANFKRLAKGYKTN